MKNRSIIRRRVWLWLPIALFVILLIFIIRSFIYALPIKRQLDGMIFSNVKDLTFDGEKYTAIQYTVDGSFINQKSIPVWSDDPFDGSVVYQSFIDGNHFYFIYKGLSGKYIMKWGKQTPSQMFATAYLDINENGEIEGLFYMNYYHRIDKALF